MSTGSDWTLDPDRLRKALERWRALSPDDRSRRFVNEFLMDLVKDPFEAGEEDRNTGVFTGKAGPNIVMDYVPDPERRRIAVADISFA